MVECERCHRHVRASEETCPFCARGPGLTVRVMNVVGGALTTLVLAACYGTVDGSKYTPTGDTGLPTDTDTDTPGTTPTETGSTGDTATPTLTGGSDTAPSGSGSYPTSGGSGAVPPPTLPGGSGAAGGSGYTF